ncbi:MAG: beta-ketoacyl-[acyl-carrier-protein] synthase family protein [Planctomycetes bacterium]|nr:beta-ketoacyl-[acyl-carrier-protein] synthase family protein [Planctomycetota bacterium]
MALFPRRDSATHDDPPRAVVTGLGPVSAVGLGRNAFYQALLEGRPGFGPITLCDASRSPARIAAEVKGFRMGDFVEGGRVIERWAPRPVQLALAAAVLALHDAELDLSSVSGERMALVVGTGAGNFAHVAEQAGRWAAGGELAPAAAFTSIHHSAACVLTSFFDLRGVATTLSTGCNSGVDAVGQALRTIQAGAADAVLVVGVDCEVVPEILAALNASGSLATRYNDEPARASRPWDAARDGNVIGEGAGALVIEREDAARARGARLYARVAGYHMASAGGGRRYSHDAPDLEHGTAARALRGALDDAGWSPGEVDLVNANGSASVLYDALEARALTEVFGPGAVPVHSIKSMLGQHGAASSAFQCTSACLTLRRGIAPPTVNHEVLDPACAGLDVLTRPLAQAFERVLVHSIGLGGFYYSAAAFERGPWPLEENLTGLGQVAWSAAHHPRHLPTPEYQAPLTPWSGARGFSVEAPGP